MALPVCASTCEQCRALTSSFVLVVFFTSIVFVIFCSLANGTFQGGRHSMQQAWIFFPLEKRLLELYEVLKSFLFPAALVELDPPAGSITSKAASVSKQQPPSGIPRLLLPGPFKHLELFFLSVQSNWKCKLFLQPSNVGKLIATRCEITFIIKGQAIKAYVSWGHGIK